MIRPSWAKVLIPHRAVGELARLAADYYQAALALHREVEAHRLALRSARRFEGRSLAWHWADGRLRMLAVGCVLLEAARDRRRDGLLGAWPLEWPGLEVDGVEIWREPHRRKLGLWTLAVVPVARGGRTCSSS